MRRSTILISTILGIISLTACSKKDSNSDNSPTEHTLTDTTYLVKESGDLSITASNVKGTGKVVAKTPLTDSGNHYQLTFTLEDGGELYLFAHAESSLAGGIEVRFQRAANVLKVSLAKGETIQDVSNQFQSFNAASPVSISLDIHNDEEPPHILMWKEEAEAFTEATAIFNSEENGAAPGQGTGTLWGLVLKKASVDRMKITTAKFED